MKIHLEDRDEPIEVAPDQVEDQVELEDDDPYLDQGEVDSVVDKRLSRQERKLKQDLRDDNEFFAKAAQLRGLELDDDGNVKGASEEEVKELRKQLAEARQKAKRVDDLEAQVAQNRDTRLENDILQQVDDVKEDVSDVFLSVAKDRFEYDEDDDAFYPVDDDGNPRYQDDVTDVIDELRDSRPSFFKESSMGGGPEDEPGGSGGGSSEMADMSAEERARVLNTTGRPY